jgi:serine/threonine-protein kinase
MGLRPGTIIAGNIRLERLLGMGGMASVWTAEHVALKTRIAVKFMSPCGWLYESCVGRKLRSAHARGA